MIWLPRTTDNSTNFAQSLEIRGIESRLYLRPVTCTATQTLMVATGSLDSSADHL